MIYENKIDWTKGLGVLSFTQSEFKSAVLDYQIQVEGVLEDIIKRHLRDQERMPRLWQFELRIKFARALIGETPDDKIWSVVESLGKLRNQYSHSRFTETQAGKQKIQELINAILCQLKSVRPDLVWNATPDQMQILMQAHYMVQRFFREINDALDRQGVPKAMPG
jgi:hypothetical protein